MRRWVAILSLAAAILATGCNENELGIEKRTANRPPETVLSSGPPDSTSGFLYKVHMFWSGTDPDGTVDHYDFIMVDHPAANDSIRGGESTVVVEVPRPDDPRWRGTASSDSVFIALADTLRHPTQPSDSTGSAEDIRRMLWSRWHTFFVRAVDNEGAPDPTPDYRSFNATNIAPEVFLTEPIQAGQSFDGPSTIIFNWDGEDPVGNGDLIPPVASRWVIIDSQIDQLKRPTSYPDSLYVLPERYEWSPWARWDAQDGSGRRAIVRNLQQVQTLPNGKFLGYYVFAVQAMDEAGAITPVFDNRTSRKNNAVAVRVTGAVGPILTVREDFLGTTRVIGTAPPVQIEIAAGQPLRFCWEGDASRYGGQVIASRYGWNIQNTEEDSQWDQNWCASCRCTVPRTFTSGTQTLFIQVRDNAQTITEARFVLRVNQVTRSRDVLWVDDTQPVIPTSQQELTEDQRWLSIFTELSDEYNFTFDTIQDVFDVQANKGTIPPIGKVFDYKAVVWSVRETQQATALAELARFVDPFLEKNQGTARAFNFLGIYLRNNGRLWIHGFRPAKLLWVELTPQQGQVAVDVTTWDDDPEEQHPAIDSVGTLSLLYAMGVEMFDCGAGTGCGTPTQQRNRSQHFCLGLARAVPQGSEQQTFTTATFPAAPHTHTVRIQTADVDLAGGGNDVTYQTEVALNHQHNLTLTPDDFLALQRGETIVRATDVAADPTPHSHDVTLVDEVGLWGLPPMSVSPGWGPAPSVPGRANVELFNMAASLFQEGLRPRLGISVPLYTYVSGVPENREQSPPILYPLTADKQTVALLAKGNPSDRFFSRAICGFEPEGLTATSHKALSRYILVRHFRTGIGDAP